MIAKKYGTRLLKVSDVRSIVYHEAVYYIILKYPDITDEQGR